MTNEIRLHPTLTSPVEYKRPKTYRDAAAEMDKLHEFGVACVAVEHGPTNHVVQVYRSADEIHKRIN